MARVVDVPLNTAIADLDEALRKLLRRELSRHGFEAVEIAFDAPSKEWSGKLTGPTVDLFLYDLREAVDRAVSTPTERRANGQAVVIDPPLHLELTYAVTSWTKAVEDEHRLLSQVLAVLFSFSEIPAELLGDNPASTLSRVETAVGRPREEKADFWTSVGGQYKASIDFVAHIVIESGATFVRGPQVRTQTVRVASKDVAAAGLEELHRLGGTVRSADGEPAPAAWIVMPEAGLWTASDELGRFTFTRLRAGRHRLLARSVDGHEADSTVTLPGERADLVLGAGARRRSGG
ncbi:MAG: Pvc16 family protein [Solirubrobacteraceae bacterium]